MFKFFYLNMSFSKIYSGDCCGDGRLGGVVLQPWAAAAVAALAAPPPHAAERARGEGGMGR